MGETEVAASSSTPVAARKSFATYVAKDKKSKSPKKPRKPKASSSHPKVAEMVNQAIDDLNAEKAGISLQAIKKYIMTNYKVDMNRQAIFVRRYLKSAVTKGSLTQTKGTGASGTFKKVAPASSGSKTARQQAIAAKPKKAATSAKKSPKKTKALAKKPVVKTLKAKTPAKKVKATSKPKKAKSTPKKGKK